MVAIFRPVIHGWDGAAYYSWLRSAVIDGDLDTGDEIKHFEELQEADVQSQRWNDQHGRSATGLWINHWPVGSAVLWSPFFLAAHGAVRGLSAVGVQIPADGYSQPYVWLTMLGTTLWGLAGLLMVYRIGRSLFDDFSATLASICAWLASPLVFYMFVSPAMAHSNDVFANALFLWVWFVTRERRTAKGWFALGLAAGLAAMVRNQNALLVVFPGLELAWTLLHARSARALPTALRPLGHGVLLAVGALLAFLPQMVVWQAVFGSFLVLNPQQVSSGLGFDWSAPHLLDSLFSSRGVFVWHPVLLLGALGLSPLARRDRRLALFLAINMLLQAYLIGSWDAWQGTPAFGARYFLCLLPGFQLGLTALVAWARRRASVSVLAGAGAALVVWNGGLLVQYTLQLIPRGGDVSVGQMVSNQFLVVPGYVGRVVGLVLAKFGR
jgi:hypothetical protein